MLIVSWCQQTTGKTYASGQRQVRLTVVLLRFVFGKKYCQRENMNGFAEELHSQSRNESLSLLTLISRVFVHSTAVNTQFCFVTQICSKV